MVCSGKSQIEHALEIAAEAHQGQYRKGTDTPYISHPYAVGLLLMEAGCTEAVIIAGILHDTVEDTPLTLDFIREEFGEQVASIVEGCSENKSLRWRARKTERIEALKTASMEVCLVTCADKLHNLRTIISEYAQIGDAVWERFHGEVADQGWYYRSMTRSLQAHLATVKTGQKQGECDKLVNDVVNRQFNSIFHQLQRAVAYLFQGENQ